MRAFEPGTVLNVRAIGGLHVVTLAWDFAAGQEDKREGLLGFAIERTEFRNNQPIERYFIRGIKRFKSKDEGLPPGTPVPTSEHPIQSFQWGDYTAKPGTTYDYRVVPVSGQPKLLELHDEWSTTVRVRTEIEHDGGKDGARHDVYFNRGAAGSQAYARKFKDPKPDETKPESDQMKWLSRGLFEALLEFIGEAGEGDALRAMLYEFRYLPVGNAFREAADRGVDVKICYEAQEYVDDNEAMIRRAHIKPLCTPQKARDGIRHNKFIVLMRGEKPVAVWTGSTNISAGGIFGHSNVGHAIWDEEVAHRYFEYWTRLADPDVKTATLKAANLNVEPTPGRHSLPPADRMLTLFSPRDDKEACSTLEWYADLMRGGRGLVCMTFAFNLDDCFRDVLERGDETLRYALFDKRLDKKTETDIRRVRNSVIAAGGILKDGDLETFRAETLTGFNRNKYIHTKFMLVDPLGGDPIVVTGSANFSAPSQYKNDENMLVIRSNQRVADIYFGEFMRIFDHLYARYLVRIIKEAGTGDPDAGFLKKSWAEWGPAHFEHGPKQLRREYFMGGAVV